MSDRNRADAHPDSPPEDDVIDEGRGSVEAPDSPPEDDVIDEGRGSVEAPGKPRSPLDGAGIEDGVGGTAGVTKNQDRTAQ